MSALDVLLGPCSPATVPGRCARSISFPNGEQVHLQEDESAEQVIFFSLPGILADREWLAARAQPWRHQLPHPRHPEVQCFVSVDQETAQVYLADVWPRAALHAAEFDAFLEDHRERYRAWKTFLASPAADEPDFDARLFDPHRFS